MAMALASPDTQLTGIDRAAILIMALDRAVARQLLQQMDTDEIRRVALAMAEIDKVEAGVLEKVVADFIRELYEVSLMPHSGGEFVKNVLPDLLDEQRRKEVLPSIQRRVNRDFEAFIAARPATAVSALLRDEHPQTQAVALSLMGTENAARVLKLLDPEEQGDLTLRMARLNRVPGDLADEITSSLRQALLSSSDYLQLGGVDRTARVLGRLNREENSRLLEQVAIEDDRLADNLRRRMVVFEDLSVVDNRGLQTLLKHIEREDLILALKGTTADVAERFLTNMSSRAAEEIQEEIEILPRVPRSRVREAQEQIVTIAMELEQQGLLYLPGSEDEDEG